MIKILYITTIGVTMRFFESFIKGQLDMGNEVDIATNENAGKDAVPNCYREWGCHVYHIDTSRSPISFGNIQAVKQIREIVSGKKYDIVHCHTPLAAMATRMACRNLRHHGVKVFYTAHGFHFYSGASLKNWLLYFPVEWLCSWWTDVLITINKEDYKRSVKILHANKNVYIAGVGIDTKKFNPARLENPNLFRKKKRREIGVPQNAFLITSVGELSQNKNHSIIIRSMAKINDNNIHYVIVGDGKYEKKIRRLVDELNLEKQVHLIGHRNDVSEIYACSDVCAFPSIREGQGLAAIEGMASGLPLLCSDNRGLRGVIDNKNAVICHCDDIKAFFDGIKKLKNNPQIRISMGNNNFILSKKFDVSIINQKLCDLYHNATL